jgi:pimeloyl-ACP methyl ester carboxylesterase
MSFLIGGTGEPLLLLHGIPGSSYTWERAGRLLAERYLVIIPDLRGFGDSDPPDGDFYTDAQAIALRRLLQVLDIEQFSVGAHDFGAPVALTLMRLHPALRVKKLVLSATNLFTDTYVPPPLRLARVPVLGDLFFWMATGNRVGLRMIYAAAARNKKELTIEAFNRHLTSSGIDLTRRIFQRSLADLQGNYGPIQEMLPNLDQPTLVLWGNKDPFFSTAVAERTRSALTNATLKIYQNTGHFVPEERSTLVSQDMMSFLGSNSVAPAANPPL